VLYYPYGETRWSDGTLPTDYQFTGQRADSYIDMYQMGARWYNPYINRWIQPDTIIPDPANPQSLNRFSYVLENPLRYSDPTGYFSEEEIMGFFGVEAWKEVLAFFEEGGYLEGKWGWLEVLRKGQVGEHVYIAEDSGLWLRGGSSNESVTMVGTFSMINVRYCQMLWIKISSAASIDGVRVNKSSGTGSNCSISAWPFGNATPALTKATR